MSVFSLLICLQNSIVNMYDLKVLMIYDKQFDFELEPFYSESTIL